VIVCTDRNYLIGACVAISSLIRHNAPTVRNHPIVIVCSNDAEELAVEVLRYVAENSRVRIHMIPAASVLSDVAGVRFRTGWGAFTAGRGLSEAAYYRIFVIKQLIRRGMVGRAVYLDSDTSIGPGVRRFFTIDLDGKALGVRFELQRPHIIAAARKLGLEPTSYFNSGVMVFDLAHPMLANALDKAIDLAVNRPELLTFVDQCALNLAFRGLTLGIQDELNYFVRPGDEIDEEVRPVVWHFLEYLKPWDPTYAGNNCRPWIDEFVALREIVPVDVLSELMLIQFEGHGRARPDDSADPRSASRTRGSRVMGTPKRGSRTAP